jgi:putative component of membrane protein insertase Oxa1/YidC/SpoIIIJ protein YidD
MNLLPLLAALAVFSMPLEAAERETREFLAAPAAMALWAYQHWISPAKGSTCPMEPSDSAYAKQAIRRKGFVRGALDTADRLHRCGHDLSKYSLVDTPRGPKYADPVR